MNPVYRSLPIPIQNLACTLAGYRRLRQRFTPHFFSCLRRWESAESATLEGLHRIQFDRLSRLLTRARDCSPFYSRLPKPEVDPQDPRNSILAMLAGIPPLGKDDYRTHFQDILARDLPTSRIRRGKTSGTTGSAIPIAYTPEALAEEFATVWRLRRRAGVAISDAHFTFGGHQVVPLSQKGPPFWRRNYSSGQTLFSLYHMSSGHLPSYVGALHDLPAVYAQGYPSALHLIARAMLDSGRPLPRGKLKAVFTSSESLLAFQRTDIEDAFQAPIWDRYGSAEFAASMTACRLGKLHVDMEFGIVEVEPHEVTEEYVRGPLLVTGFANDATPLIRYRIGDVGTRLNASCPCGRPGDVFEDIDGRLEDYVVTPEGRWVGRLDHVFKELHDVREAQIHQETSASIRVLVVPANSYNDASRRRLIAELRARLGESIQIEVVPTASIQRERNGKFRAVISRAGKLA